MVFRRFRARVIAASSVMLVMTMVAAGSAPAAQIRCPGDTAYPGDSASRTALALWMGRSVQGFGLPPELPVMAALVQSGLQNSEGGGEVDSVGFFQMRVGTWNHGDYAGFADDPSLQMKWFVDLAAAVRQGAKNAGPGFRGDPASWGAWIAHFDRPDSPGFHPEQYQARLAEARQLLRAGCDQER
jgi:hypothetical protein